MWHKLDATFRTPRANVFFRLSSGALHTSPRAAALSHLFLKLVEDSLTEDTYLADVTDLHYSTAPEGLSGGWMYCRTEPPVPQAEDTYFADATELHCSTAPGGLSDLWMHCDAESEAEAPH